MPRGYYKDSEDWKKKGSKRINPKKAKAYNTEFAELAERLAASGATEMDIAYIFGTTTYNLRNWKRNNPDFAKAINRGKQLTKAYLIAKGMKAAAGYDWTEEKQKFVVDAEGKPTGNIEVIKTKKHQPSDGKLLMFMVSALDRQLGGDNWVAKQFVENKTEKNVNIRVIDGQKIAEQFDKLSGKWKEAIDCEFEKPKQIESDTVSSYAGSEDTSTNTV